MKQLYRLPTGIRLRSFNREEHPDEDYSFQDMQEEQILILGHVFWWGMYAR
ncbi:HTH-type transcriptional regulator PrtR [compost metagenome]